MCVDELERLSSAGYSGAAWGYDFDWEARYGTMPAGTPTIVATGFVTKGLFAAYQTLGIDKAFFLCRSACDFLQKDLVRTSDPDGAFCWSYSPLDRTSVLNATMKGARLCAQVSSITGEQELRDLARRTVTFVARRQRADGAWPYSASDNRSWVDNFHTGYVLECLSDYQRCTGDSSFARVTRKGWDYYRGCFFTNEGIPKYYDHRAYPIDATTCAQAILTLCAFDDVAAARRVALWTIGRMQRSDGAFIYQIHRWYRIRIPYARWSVAWMLCALARLAATDAP
jgi:hypothetical protein